MVEQLTDALRDAIASRRDLLGAAATLIVAFMTSLRLFELIWRRDALADITGQPGGWLGALIVVACSAIVHELLHGFAWHTLARVPWRSISFRPSWRGMGFVAQSALAIPTPAYRSSAALPALVMGVVPIVVGFVTGWGLSVLWGLFFLLECFADIATLFAVRGVPSRAWVRDHPDKLGCRVVAD